MGSGWVSLGVHFLAHMEGIQERVMTTSVLGALPKALWLLIPIRKSHVHVRFLVFSQFLLIDSYDRAVLCCSHCWWVDNTAPLPNKNWILTSDVM